MSKMADKIQIKEGTLQLVRTEFPDSIEYGKAGARIKLYTDLRDKELTKQKIENAKAALEYCMTAEKTEGKDNAQANT